MEPYADDPNELKNVPTGMETDPEADEQVIDQTEAGSRQTSLSKPDEAADEQGPSETTDDELTNALAHAIDGSGTGLAGAPPVAPTVGRVQKIKTEGATGASITDGQRKE